MTELLDGNDSLVGTVFADRYRLTSVLGKGGRSVVYSATDCLENTTVAVKMLHPQMLLSPTNIKRFQQEAQTASDLSHPNLITVHHLGVTADQVPYIVMELIDGVSLSEVLKTEGRLRPERCLDIFMKACAGLSAAHEKGIVHRNIKSSNIMLVASGDGGELVKVIDFGIAKLLPTEGEEAQRLTKTGKMIGSPIYMSPEQWRAQPQDARSDVYSMGCLMYEALSGKPPLVGSSLFETMYKHLSDVPEGLGDAIPDARLREQLEAILFKAMAKEPELRYQSMQELSGALEQVRAGASGGLVARLHSLWQTSRLKRAPRRAFSPVVIGLASAAILLLGLSGWALIALFGPSSKQAEMSWLKIDEPLARITPHGQKVEAPVKMLMGVGLQAGDESVAQLVGLGRFRKELRQWDLAASAFARSFSIASMIGAPKDIAHYATQIDLADCYYALGRYREAEPLYREGIAQLYGEISEAALWGPVGRLGDIYLRLGDIENASDYLSWADRMPRRSDDRTEWVLRRSQLADVHRLQGRLDDAQERFSQSVDSWKRLDGDMPHKNLVICLYYLGEIKRSQGDLQGAARSYREALNLAGPAFGLRHQYVANILDGYSDVLWRQNRWIESLQMKAEANRIRRNA